MLQRFAILRRRILPLLAPLSLGLVRFSVRLETRESNKPSAAGSLAQPPESLSFMCVYEHLAKPRQGFHRRNRTL